MENTEVMNETLETVVEEGAEKVFDVNLGKVGLIVGAVVAVAGVSFGGYKLYKKKHSKEITVDVEATEVKQEDSEEPEKK